MEALINLTYNLLPYLDSVMSKYVILIVAIIICPALGISQDSLVYKAVGKKAIYQEWEEFKNNSPLLVNSFTIDTHYTRALSMPDTLQTRYYCRFEDSAIKITKAFALFDGTDLYLPEFVSGDSILFIKLPCAGKFPFLVEYYKVKHGIMPASSLFSIAGLVELTAKTLDAAVSTPQKTVFYMNEKGKFHEATPQSIRYLLRNEKDLVKEFDDEPKMNIEIFIKYLLKMNQRYPL
ncbi:MAG TPA: hypothetical protein PLY34_21135 [Ferruginibacter sp.]|nr:hypothetical protein [Ferruginibacter sp.]